MVSMQRVARPRVWGLAALTIGFGAWVARADCDIEVFLETRGLTWVRGTSDGGLVDAAVEPDEIVANLDGSVLLVWGTDDDAVSLHLDVAP